MAGPAAARRQARSQLPKLSFGRSTAPALLPLRVDFAEAVLQPLSLLTVGSVGQPVADLPLLILQPLTPLPVGLFLAVARRWSVPGPGVPGLRRVSGSRIPRCSALPRRRRRRRRGLSAIAR